MAQTRPLTENDITCPPVIKPRMAIYLTVIIALLGLGLFAITHYEQAILGWMQENQEWMREFIAAHPVWGAVLYVSVFALFIGFYVPGGIVLLLLAGAIFPMWEANFYANLGNMLGATIGFMLSRYLLRDEVQSCYGHRLAPINEGIRHFGWLYLLILRIAPVLPSPVVNLGMGLTPINLWVYMLVTLLGRIPMTALYVTLGMELGEINALSDLLSFKVIASLIGVGVLMLLGHLALQHCRRRRAQGKSC